MGFDYHALFCGAENKAAENVEYHGGKLGANILAIDSQIELKPNVSYDDKVVSLLVTPLSRLLSYCERRGVGECSDGNGSSLIEKVPGCCYTAK